MSSDQKSIMRCAINTRKSSEEGLEQSFNSLDAQRESCEAFILSQGRIVERCIAGRPSPQDRLAAPFAERPSARPRRRFQLRVLFLAHFETDGFRAQWRLHHVPASSLDISAETSSRA
jgi:hypothetical protein